MQIQNLTVEEAFISLQSRPDGLTASEAAHRLQEYGPNEVETVAREPLVLVFLKEFIHFFAIILWVAAGLAFYAEAHDPGQGMASLGWAIVGVITVNGAFSFWQAYRAERAVQALQKLLPQVVKIMRDGTVRRASPAELVPGDVILLEGGDRVPADCRVVEACVLRVNTATITGESMPHSRDTAPSTNQGNNHSLLEARNVLLAGTSVVAGEARAVVFATGRHTAFGEIARLTQTTEPKLSPLQREIVWLSQLVAALALALGVVFFLIGRVVGLSFWANFMFAIGIIVANVPEGLLPTVTLALAMGSQRMARRNALIRHLPAVETLGSTTVICTDKTGTLTMNCMVAKRLHLAGEELDAADEKSLAKATRDHPRFFDIARHCHNLTEAGATGQGDLMGDPMEVALVDLAKRAGPVPTAAERLGEIPFDSQRKRLVTLHRLRDGDALLCKGAPEIVIQRCNRIDTAGGAASMSIEERQAVLAAADSMARTGLRVLAFAYRSIDRIDPAAMEHDLILSGLVALEDPPRPDVPEAMQRCAEAGIKVIMVTGDHPQTGVAVAREIGLVHSASPNIITGDQLAKLSPTQLQIALDAKEIVFARVAADQKLRIVQALKRKREIVAVTGDGVNDAPALRAAHIGIAMGRSGTDVAREAADMILLDDHFASIVAAVEEGRSVFANIRKFLTYILTSNVPELVPYLAFVLLRIPLPLTIIQILAVDLGTDMVPALGLGAEPPHPDVMKRPPRARTERLLRWALVVRAYLWLGMMQAAAAMAAFFFVLRSGGWQYGMIPGPQDPLYRQATTGCLTAIIVMQVANVFICRSEVQSVFRFSLRSNPLILCGAVAELLLILAIDYTPWGNATFGTAPIAPSVWMFIIPFALVMLALEELRKMFFRRMVKNPSSPGFQ